MLKWMSPRYRACPLIVAFFTFLVLFFVDEPIFDEMGSLTVWAMLHYILQVEACVLMRIKVFGTEINQKLFDFPLTSFAKYVIIWTIDCDAVQFRGCPQFSHHYLVKTLITFIFVDNILMKEIF